MFWTFEAVFKLRNLRKLHILRLRARSVICIKDRQNSQEGGTTFARHVQILPRHRLTNQKRFLCFNQQQIMKELVPQSSSLRLSCAKEKSSGVMGRTQLVRRMRSSIVSMIQSILEFRFMRVIPHSGLNGR